MKLILDIEGTPEKGDLLVYDGKRWKATTKERLFLEQTNKNIEIEEEIAQFKSDVNKKLRDFHEVLQLLAKKEE